jgi:glycosyltransferase involved in cell wall biosynthesis
VAIPVFNEEHVLDRLHALVTDACRRAGGSCEVLYVNDGSRDGTAGVLGRLARADPHVTVVEPRGPGAPPSA